MSASKESKQISICVFCGAGEGTDPAFAQAARALADLFYRNNWSLGIAPFGGIA
jgi:predicted Rossmann-fold nucleotide-binding protein